MTTYYGQYSAEEILSMHGVEPDFDDDEECYVEDQDEEDEEDEEQEYDKGCPRCTHGCNYCV